MPKDDDIDPIPSISARRDGEAKGPAVPRPRGGARGNGSGRGTGGRSTESGPPARPGLLSGIGLVASLLIAVSACAWAWQLQERLTQAGFERERFEKRIADLEDRLADTDEGMSQNAAVQAAKIRELDSEVRKLWDNVWARSKERLGKLEASEKRFASAIAANSKTIEATRSDLSSALTDIAQLTRVAGDMERLVTSSRNSQVEIERVADALNAIELELARLGKRVGGNEESIQAINAFRQSTNASINQLRAGLRALQPGGG
jgi:methyl-accepting chemotaxis protein